MASRVALVGLGMAVTPHESQAREPRLTFQVMYSLSPAGSQQTA